jgi:hypothetical protein
VVSTGSTATIKCDFAGESERSITGSAPSVSSACQDTATTVKNKVPEVGRARSRAKHAQAIEMGKKLIDIRSRLPRGHWLPWVQEKSGLSYATVQRYMRMAKVA